ncbi:MAG TPA: Maf family protein [Polyangiaceae bacterium]|jgi:septum formation protein
MRISREHPLLLASASPRRRELLELARIPFEVVRAPVDESPSPGEQALAYAPRVARAKLAAANAALPSEMRARAAIVLAADTTVILDGRIFGKPESDDDARTMLRALAGRVHEVMTAFALGDPRTSRLVAEVAVRTSVEMRSLDAAEIDGYVSTGEPSDKAGAYAIQGMASSLVRRIEGSHTNVIGLPTAELVTELRRLELL